MPIVNPRFLIGFELEGFIHPDHRAPLRDYIVNLYGGQVSLGGRILPDLGTDGSLHILPNQPQWSQSLIGIEIRTPPIDQDQAVTNLNELLDHLRQMTAQHLFDTNETCGFHVSVSEEKTFKGASAAHRELFAFRFMRHFQTTEWLKQFGREGNAYTAWNTKPESRVDTWQHNQYKAHHTAVNIKNLTEQTHPSVRRIEIRCGGGKKYHEKPHMPDYISHILETLEYCASRPYSKKAAPVSTPAF